MKTRYKIILIVGIVLLVGFASIMTLPAFLMISSNAIAKEIISSTPDSVFEEEFAKIPEVALFIKKYPNYNTGHYADFLGWKIIAYDAKIDTEKYIHMEVRKSVLHQGVKIIAGCSEHGTDFTFNIPQEQVMDYLKNDECLKMIYYTFSNPDGIITWTGTAEGMETKLILPEGYIDELIEIVFGDARKSWTVYPGGAGWMPPQDSSLTLISKEVAIGVPPLDFEAMLNDPIFIEKCISNGGVWNLTYHDCEGLGQICKDIGGVSPSLSIRPYCTGTGTIDTEPPLKFDVCRGYDIVRLACVFPYEN